MEPVSPDETAGSWTAIGGAGLEIQHRIEVRDGLPVLVVSLRGRVESHVPRQRLATAISDAVERASSAAVDPELAVLDTTGMDEPCSSVGGYRLDELLGKFIDDLPRGLRRMWLWAARPNDDCGIRSWFGEDMVVPSLDDALDRLAARRNAGVFEERRPDGRLASSHRWTDRGCVVTWEPDERDGRITSLWYRTRLIERLEESADGTVRWHAQWPYPDGRGDRNQACHLGAYVYVEANAIKRIGSISETLPAGWLESIRAHRHLEELDLEDTGVTDAEVLQVLEWFPHLHTLRLSGTQVTDALADALARGVGAALDRVVFGDSAVSAAARERLEAVRPDLTVD
jgi:hypothetical protein